MPPLSVSTFVPTKPSLVQAAKALPNSARPVLVILAHPDDDVFVSGTLSQLARLGYPVHMAYLTQGEAGRDVSGRGLTKNTLAAERLRETQKSLQQLGIIQPPIFLNLGDGQLSEKPAALKHATLQLLRHIRPHWVISFHPQNGMTGHPDHQVTGQVLATLLKELQQPTTEQAAQDRALLKPLLENYQQGKGLWQMTFSEHEAELFKAGFPANNTSWQKVQGTQSPYTFNIPLTQTVQALKANAMSQYRSQFSPSDMAGFYHFYAQVGQEGFTHP